MSQAPISLSLRNSEQRKIDRHIRELTRPTTSIFVDETNSPSHRYRRRSTVSAERNKS